MEASFNADLDVVDFIKAVFNNKTVKKYTEPFAAKVTGWLKPLIRKKDAELATLLEERPDDPLADCKLRAISKDFEGDPALHLKLREEMKEGRKVVNQVIRDIIIDSKGPVNVKAKQSGTVDDLNQTIEKIVIKGGDSGDVNIETSSES